MSSPSPAQDKEDNHTLFSSSCCLLNEDANPATARFFKELTDIFATAFHSLKDWVGTARHCPSFIPAIVFDIDHTLLWYENSKIRRIVHPAVEFLQRVQREIPRVKIIFLTARRCDGTKHACLPFSSSPTPLTNREFTLEELQHIGCIIKDENCHLFIMPMQIYTSLSSETEQDYADCQTKMRTFKDAVRRVLESDLNVSVFLNVGDQPTDHHGIHFLHHLRYCVAPSPTILSTSFE